MMYLTGNPIGFPYFFLILATHVFVGNSPNIKIKMQPHLGFYFEKTRKKERILISWENSITIKGFENTNIVADGYHITKGYDSRILSDKEFDTWVDKDADKNEFCNESRFNPKDIIKTFLENTGISFDEEMLDCISVSDTESDDAEAVVINNGVKLYISYSGPESLSGAYLHFDTEDAIMAFGKALLGTSYDKHNFHAIVWENVEEINVYEGE